MPQQDDPLFVEPSNEDATPEPQPVPQWQALVENTGAAGAQTNPSDPIVQLVTEYKEAIQARDEANDRYLRAAAEFSNARRRAEARADNEVRAAREGILGSFLPVVDDLSRAVQAVPAEEKNAPWIDGFTLIQRKLETILERQGVVALDTEGKHFDPTLHQAVIVEAVDGVESGTILQELQKGYLLDGKILRPAMVKVAQ